MTKHTNCLRVLLYIDKAPMPIRKQRFKMFNCDIQVHKQLQTSNKQILKIYGIYEMLYFI